MIIIYYCIGVIILFLAFHFIAAAIYVKKEMKRGQSEQSLKDHNWKKFKNQPWE